MDANPGVTKPSVFHFERVVREAKSIDGAGSVFMEYFHFDFGDAASE